VRFGRADQRAGALIAVDMQDVALMGIQGVFQPGGLGLGNFQPGLSLRGFVDHARNQQTRFLGALEGQLGMVQGGAHYRKRTGGDASLMDIVGRQGDITEDGALKILGLLMGRIEQQPAGAKAGGRDDSLEDHAFDGRQGRNPRQRRAFVGQGGTDLQIVQLFQFGPQAFGIIIKACVTPEVRSFAFQGVCIADLGLLAFTQCAYQQRFVFVIGAQLR
jgi:hypothetical protein